MVEYQGKPWRALVNDIKTVFIKFPADFYVKTLQGALSDCPQAA